MVVGNPEGFKTESVFQLNQIRVILDPKSLLTNRIHIREILIDAPEITYEVGLSGSNIGDPEECGGVHGNVDRRGARRRTTQG